jgi:hypothetical protein
MLVWSASAGRRWQVSAGVVPRRALTVLTCGRGGRSGAHPGGVGSLHLGNGSGERWKWTVNGHVRSRRRCHGGEDAVMRSVWSAFPVFGVVAGAAIVSSGALLGGSTAAGAAAVIAAAPRGCGQPPAATSAARSVPASLPALVLDAASLSPAKASIDTTDDSAPASATAITTAAAETPSSAAATPEPTGSAPATPSSSASASPSTSISATPSSSAPASPSSSASASPSASAPASPSPSGTASGSASPSPSPTPAGSSPPVQLCLEVQAVTARPGVHPGGTARYAIWAWPEGGAAAGVTVTVGGTVGGNDVTPQFTACPAASGRTCTAGGIAGGTSDELAATINVPGRATAGEQTVLTATARASDAAAPPAAGAAGAAVTITAKPSATRPGTPAPVSGAAGAGLGATLPAGLPPTLPSAGDPAASLFELPGPVTPAGSPGSLFPVVTPQQSASPDSEVLPGTRGIRAADAAAAFPFGTRLIGGELGGLAVLAAALALAIVRFSLRRPARRTGKD